MNKPRKKISFDRACAILYLHYGYSKHGVTNIRLDHSTNTYTVIKDGKTISLTEDEVIALAPSQKLSKVEKGMHAHWFRMDIIDSDKDVVKMLRRYLSDHPEAKIEGFYRKYDAGKYAKYFRLVSKENYQDLELEFDTGYSPIHYLKEKPSNIFKTKADVNEWIDKYTQQRDFQRLHIGAR